MADEVPTQPIDSPSSTLYDRLRQETNITMMPTDWIPSQSPINHRLSPSHSLDRQEYERRLQQMERLVPNWATEKTSSTPTYTKSLDPEQPLR